MKITSLYIWWCVFACTFVFLTIVSANIHKSDTEYERVLEKLSHSFQKPNTLQEIPHDKEDTTQQFHKEENQPFHNTNPDSSLTMPGTHCMNNVSTYLAAVAFAVFFSAAAHMHFSAAYYPSHQRIIHRILMIAFLISAISYLALAYGTGITRLGTPEGRCFYYFRWLDLMITVPLLVVVLGIFAQKCMSEAVYFGVLTSMMIIPGLLSGIESVSMYRWMYFGLNLILFLPIARQLVSELPYEAIIHSNRDIQKKTEHLCFFLFSYFAMYHIFFALAQITSIIASRTDIIFMILVDIISKFGFAYSLISQRNLISEALQNRTDFLIPTKIGETTPITGRMYGTYETGGEHTPTQTGTTNHPRTIVTPPH